MPGSEGEIGRLGNGAAGPAASRDHSHERIIATSWGKWKGKEVESRVSEITVKAVYFDRAGNQNTERTLEIAKARADELGIRTILVATTTGETGARAAEFFPGYNLVVVTHPTGWSKANEQELTNDKRLSIEGAGAKVLTCQPAFSGVGRAVRDTLRTYGFEEMINYALRHIFSDGMKVACEIALMAADAGLVRTDEEVIAIAGRARGADTAVVLVPANTRSFFDLRVLEILCKPRLGR